jgi:hypothetical protein
MVMFREWTYQIYYLSSSGKPHASWLLYGSDGDVLSEIVDSKAQQYCLLKKNISMMCRKKGAGGKRQRNARQTRTKNVRLQDGVPSYIL